MRVSVTGEGGLHDYPEPSVWTERHTTLLLPLRRWSRHSHGTVGPKSSLSDKGIDKIKQSEHTLTIPSGRNVMEETLNLIDLKCQMLVAALPDKTRPQHTVMTSFSFPLDIFPFPFVCFDNDDNGLDDNDDLLCFFKPI